MEKTAKEAKADSKLPKHESVASSSPKSNPETQTAYCESCIGVTYFHRSYLEQNLQPRCFGLRRSKPIPASALSSLKSDFRDGESSKGFMDEMWCFGISRKPKVVGGKTIIPQCGPGLRLLFIRQKRLATQKGELQVPSSLPDKPIRLVPQPTPPTQENELSNLDRTVYTLNDVYGRIQRHFLGQQQFMRKLAAKSVLITRDAEFLRLWYKQSIVLPEKMRDSAERYGQALRDWFLYKPDEDDKGQQ